MEKVNVKTIYPDNPCKTYEEWRMHIRKNLIALRCKLDAYERQETSRRIALQRLEYSTYGIHSEE